MIIEKKWKDLVGTTSGHMRINPKLKKELQKIKLLTEITSISDVILLHLMQLDYIRREYPSIHAEAERGVHLPGYITVMDEVANVE